MDTSKAPHSPTRVIYVPPSADHIEIYGQQVCNGLGDEFAEAEVVQGFTQFMKIAVRIMLRHLNEEGFDNAAE